jgi:competence protein ComEC
MKRCPDLKIYSYIINKLEEEYHHLNLWYFVAFISGILLYFTLPFEPSATQVILTFCGSLATLFLRRFGLLYLFLSGIFISFSLGAGVSKYRSSSLELIGLKEQISTSVIGTVSGIKQTTRGVQVILEDVYVKKYPELNKIRINLKSEYSDSLMIGDRIKVFAFLAPPPRSVIPGGYDFGLYAYFAGLQATGYAMSMPKFPSDGAQRRSEGLVHQETFRLTSAKAVQQIRRLAYDRLVEVLGPIRGNFAAAILLGEGSGLDRTVMQNMRYSGISHILCVSGLHLSLVAMLFFIASRFLLNLSDRVAFRFNIKIIAALISLLGSFAYLLLSGMQIAATRAFIMTSIFILSIIIGRSAYPLRSIGIAAVIILSLNPEYVMHPSFQLSFIAVLSLITGYEFYMRNQWILGGGKGIFASLKLYIFSNIYSSLIASLATTPIVIYHFYISSNYSIMANLIAVPIMSFFMMPLAILAALIMPFGLDYYILKILGYFIQIVIDMAGWVCHLPGSIWYFGYITPLSLILYMLGFFWLTLWQRSWRHFGWILVFIAIILMLLSPKPDVIFDPIGKAIGAQNKEGELEIYAQRMSKFAKNYWSNWFGQKEAEVHKQDITSENHSIMTKSGKMVRILFSSNEACQAPRISGVVLNMLDSMKCGDDSLTKDELMRYGTTLVFCEKEGCRLVYEKSDRFRFK